MEKREKLCRAVAALDDNCALDHVSEQFGSILGNVDVENVDEPSHSSTSVDSVTPLIVACDKAQVTCIEWISMKTKENSSLLYVLGSPRDHAEAGNTPFHYAAHSDCIQALPLLCNMLDDEETKPATKLASLRNDNFDTPIMFASVRGHLAFLRETLRLLEKEDSQDRTKLFELVNDDGDTALSLACGHGNVDIVHFLLQEARVTVTYDIVKEAEERLNKIDAALAQVKPTPEHKARRNDAYKCLVILKVFLAKLTEATMEELLAEEDEANAAKMPKVKAKKKPKHFPAAESRGKSQVVLGSSTESNILEDEPQKTDSVSTRSARESEQERDAGTSKERARQPATALHTSTLLPETQRTSDFGTNLDVDAIIEALCLDSSMLLLSSEDMASTLSPCQLDAVAAVLRNQIQAVKEARAIQFCLRNQATENGFDTWP